ncbi:MAG: hypothetical protein CMD96_07045 [Gammaproteobacteria bacterium]|nr:hypothetical protein [Gammaproteobacteria bacterium]HJP18976.1 hypothetical protein [Nitrospinota bacterium]
MEYLSQIFLKGNIPPPELKKLLATGSPVENVVKALTGGKQDANLQTLQLSLLKNYLPEKIPLVKAFDNLIRFLSSLPKSELTPQTKETLITTMKSVIIQGEKIDENLLKNFITKTGLNYEADIKKLVLSKPGELIRSDQTPENLKASLNQSIKGQLLKIVQELETKLSKMQQSQNQSQLKELQALLKNVKTTLSNVELNQILNYYSKQEDGFLQFQIPLSPSETVNLYVKDNSEKDEQKDSRKKEDVSLIFHLNLKTMGNLRIDVQVLDKTMSCQFYVEDKEVSKFISSMLPKLENQLGESYSINHLSCSIKEKSFFEDEMPEKKLFKRKTQIINIEA